MSLSHEVEILGVEEDVAQRSQQTRGDRSVFHDREQFLVDQEVGVVAG